MKSAFFLVLLFLSYEFCAVKGSATYPDTKSTVFQVLFDPVFWLTTFHSYDVHRQVRSRWIKLLPDMMTGRLRFGRAEWFDMGKRTSHNYL